MITIIEKKKVRKHIYYDKQKEWNYYMVELEMNQKDEITKISEYVSKDLEKWELLGKPYTYTYLILHGGKGITLKDVYKHMYNKTLKFLDIYNIIEE